MVDILVNALANISSFKRGIFFFNLLKLLYQVPRIPSGVNSGSGLHRCLQISTYFQLQFSPQQIALIINAYSIVYQSTKR